MPNSSATPASSEPSALYDPPELRKDRWEQAGRRLLAKMIGEFAHEGIIQPEPEPEPEPERLLDSAASPDLERSATLVPYPSPDREESGFAPATASPPAPAPTSATAPAPGSDQARKLIPTASPDPSPNPFPDPSAYPSRNLSAHPETSPIPDRTPMDSAPSGDAHPSVTSTPHAPHPRYAPYTLRLDAAWQPLLPRPPYRVRQLARRPRLADSRGRRGGAAALHRPARFPHPCARHAGAGRCDARPCHS